MRVRELIEKLQEFGDDDEVYYSDSEMLDRWQELSFAPVEHVDFIRETMYGKDAVQNVVIVSKDRPKDFCIEGS